MKRKRIETLLICRTPYSFKFICLCD